MFLGERQRPATVIRWAVRPVGRARGPRWRRRRQRPRPPLSTTTESSPGPGSPASRERLREAPGHSRLKDNGSVRLCSLLASASYGSDFARRRQRVIDITSLTSRHRHHAIDITPSTSRHEHQVMDVTSSTSPHHTTEWRKVDKVYPASE